jgi:hypothetical protein
MNRAFCKKDKAEILARWKPADHGQKKSQGRFWKHTASLHHVSFAMLYVVLLILVYADAAGQTTADVPQTSPPPGIDIRAEVQPEVATVGDSLRIDLDIEMPEGYQAKIPEPEKQMGDFAILDFLPGPIGNESGMPQEPKPTEALQHHRARIIAAVYKTGKFVFPAIPVKLQTPDGEEITLSSPPLNIEIQSVLIDENPKLKDLKKQAEISEPIRWILWLIIALVASLLGAFTWYYWRKRRRRPVSYSPEQMKNLLDIAEADLKELLSRGFPENGMVKRFYVLLSEIVKRILESAYEIHTAEKTTSEIMDSVHRGPALEFENRKRIESFLTRCDIVKFAKYIPKTAEHEAISKDALQILEDAKKAVASRQSPVASDNYIQEDLIDQAN